MNINSLPDEMLVRLANYFDTDVIVRIRKTNKHINDVFKSNGLCKLLPIQQCSIFGQNLSYGGFSCFLLISMTLDKLVADAYGIRSQHRKEIYLQNNSRAVTLDKVLSRIKVTEVFALSSNGESTEFCDEDLDVLLKNKQSLKGCKELCFYEIEFSCIEDNMVSLIRQMRKLRSLRLSEVIKTSEIVFNSRVLSDRKWKTLTFNINGLATYKLKMPDREFLENVIANCEKFSIPDNNICEVRFTPNDVLNVLQNLSFAKHGYDWNLGLIHTPNGMSVKEFSAKIRAIEGLEISVKGSIQAKEDVTRKCKHFKITSKHNDTCIKFTIYRVIHERL